ncbi:hypothetical protein D3C81_2227820 [compost metagenome]
MIESVTIISYDSKFNNLLAVLDCLFLEASRSDASENLVRPVSVRERKSDRDKLCASRRVEQSVARPN